MSQQTIQDFCDKVLRLTLRGTYENNVIDPLNDNLRTFYKAYLGGKSHEEVEAAAKQVEGSLLVWGNYQNTQGLMAFATGNNVADADRLIDELYDLVEAYEHMA
jgi:hypothetical protein